MAKYLANLERKSKEEKDQLIIEWYKYSITSADKDKTNWYFIPFDMLMKKGTVCMEKQERGVFYRLA